MQCVDVLFPHVQEQLTNKMKEDHRQAMEEKDATIVLLTDDCRIITIGMFLMREIQAKTTLSSSYVNIQHLSMISFMTCHIMSRAYNDVRGMLS